MSKEIPSFLDGQQTKQIPESINVKDADPMETVEVLEDDELESLPQMEDTDVRMSKEEDEESDNDASHGTNSMCSSGGVSLVTCGPFFQQSGNSPKTNVDAEEDSVEKESAFMEKKLQSSANQSPIPQANPETNQQTVTKGVSPTGSKQE